MESNKDIVWITWEDHRRSKELAKDFDADYVYIKSNETMIIRHIIKALKTILIISRNRKKIIFVQNPSRILACIASIQKLFLRYPLIVDRHTNFRLGKGVSFNPAIWFVILCSEISIRLADLTIVTNSFLKNLVESKGGRGFVLYDKIPDIGLHKECKEIKSEEHISNVLFVCTYAADEPFRSVIEAAQFLPEDVVINITGNYKKTDLEPSHMPPNVHLTGFVSEEEYQRLLSSSDAIMVLTSAEWCLVCGGYESMAAGKPLITSATQALKNFYGNSAIFTNHDSKSISTAILSALTKKTELREKIIELRKEKETEWVAARKSLMEKLESI